MKAQTTAIITAITLVLFMLVLPLVAIEMAEEFATIGLWILSFFVLNPLLVICLSIMAGTDIRKLWWTPLVIAALFPLLFGVAIRDLVWDLYFYSAIYLPLGVLAMLGTHLGIKLRKRNKKTKR